MNWLEKYESLLFVLPMEDTGDKIPKLIRRIQIRLLEKLREKGMLANEPDSINRQEYEKCEKDFLYPHELNA